MTWSGRSVCLSVGGCSATWWLNVDERDGKGGDVGVLLLYSFCPIRRLVWKKQEDSPATPVMGRGKFMSHPAYVIESEGISLLSACYVAREGKGSRGDIHCREIR